MTTRMYTPNEIRNATEYVKELFADKSITMHEWNVYLKIMESIEQNWNLYPARHKKEIMTIMDLFDIFLDKLEYRFELTKKLSHITSLN